MHIAERNLWRSISKLLWGFDISPITDPVTGKPKPPNSAAFSVNGEVSAFEGGAVRVAIPFDVVIKPRSTQHAETINREYAEVLPTLEKYN